MSFIWGVKVHNGACLLFNHVHHQCMSSLTLLVVHLDFFSLNVSYFPHCDEPCYMRMNAFCVLLTCLVENSSYTNIGQMCFVAYSFLLISLEVHADIL